MYTNVHKCSELYRKTVHKSTLMYTTVSVLKCTKLCKNYPRTFSEVCAGVFIAHCAWKLQSCCDDVKRSEKVGLFTPTKWFTLYTTVQKHFEMYSNVQNGTE